MANALYDAGRNSFLTGAINFTSDTIKLALVSSSYTPNLSTHDFWNDVSANVVGTPQTLANKTATAGVADADDVTYTAVAGGSTVSYLVLYKDTGNTATSNLIACFDTATGLPITTSGADITIRFDSGSNKIFRL
jgi:hypothetical protein